MASNNSNSTNTSTGTGSALVHCQHHPYVQTFSTSVLSCQPSSAASIAAVLGGNAATPADKKKAKSAAPATFDVVLEDTILFPEGGGQPYDFGRINDVAVLAVLRTPTGVAHVTSAPLDVGTRVEIVLDWQRRYDHMQQHSSQHLISAVAYDMFEWATLSWWLATAPAECQIELDVAEVTAEQLQQLEARVNETIRRALPMRVHTFDTAAELTASPLMESLHGRKKHAMDEIEGGIRVVEIEGLDINMCCGTHLRSTSEMQVVSIPRYDKVRGHVRIYFLAGGRAVSALSTALEMQRQLSQVLSVGSDAHVETVKKLQADLRSTSKALTKAQKEVADHEARLLCEKAKEVKAQLLHHDDSTMAFVTLIADAYVAALGDACPLLLLTVTETAGKNDGQFILVGEANAVSAQGPVVAKIMEGRGGGRKGRYQGKVARIDLRQQALDALLSTC